jgi:predicted dehydrogenase
MAKEAITRRGFLAGAAVGAAFAVVPRHVLGAPGRTPPSEKLGIAGVGIGGMGAANVGALRGENIVALCDVDADYAARTFKRYPKAKRYADYRRMLDAQKDIDAVVVATPDHTHAVITVAAMRAGKHVFCQKPLTHSVHEARRVAEVARETKVATQMGIQGHSGEGIRLIREWIADGAIGEVREVDAWCTLSYYPWGHAWWSSRWGRRPKDTPPPPKTLDWDLWLGPAPARPYHPAYHPKVWRCWWDFGVGMMGDRGTHTLDPVVWALGLGPPSSVEATSTGLNPDTHPVSAVITFRFPGRDKRSPVKVTWYEGLRPPRPPELEDGRALGHRDGGALFKGSKGMLTCGVYGNSPRLVPESLMQAYERPEKTLPRVKGRHEDDWVRACKTGVPAGANFDYAGPLTETCLLGNVAKRMDAHLDWDSAALKVTNLPGADRYVRRPYRKGWSL